MRILVTGASGHVGRAITRHLAAAGHVVVAPLRDLARLVPAPRVETRLIGDLANPVDWHDLLAGIDAVVHAAGLAHQPPGVDEAVLHQVNAEAAGRLAAAAAARGIGRFTLISSIRAVTGPRADAVLDETILPAPTDAYGRSKRAGEEAVRSALPAAIVLRPPVVHGAGAKANMARLAALARLPVPLPLAGLSGRRSIVSDINLAASVAFLLDTPAAVGRTFHVTDGPPLTVPTMIGAMRQALGRAPGIIALPFGLDRRLAALLPARLSEPVTGDLMVTDAALRALGWRPHEDSAAGLSRLVRGEPA
jgi:UDP-glucose 4-epimerase